MIDSNISNNYSVVVKDWIGNIYSFSYSKYEYYKKYVLIDFIFESINIDIITINDEELFEIIVLNDMIKDKSDLFNDKLIDDNMNLLLFIRNPVKEIQRVKYSPIYGVVGINQNRVMEKVILVLINILFMYVYENIK